ncbi:MAG: metallophosphoesterase [Candidatus Nanoarchaeia archaeon]|nr:metallophosphoesterase [Candidatus Nanoarchaeia archaeon]
MKGYEIIDLGILVEKNTIIFSDFHIGYEEALNKKGILLPKFQFKEIITRLNKIFTELKKRKIKIEKIVINGDLKHEFGKISEQEWRETLRLLDFLLKHCKEIILVKGNHDTVLGPIAEKRNVEIVEQFIIGDILIIHGHKIPDKKIIEKCKTIIIGHEHPAVSLRDDARSEKFKCFLKGRFKNKGLVVMPSFCLAAEGTDVLSENLLSPFLKQDIRKFDVVIVADKSYNFGKLKNLL